MDYSGTIEKGEFRKAIKSLGFDAPREEVDSLFEQYDRDGSGYIDYQEMNKVMRRETELKEELQAGAMGEIATRAENKHGLRNRNGTGVVGMDKRARTLQGTFLKMEQDKALVEQLATALNKKWARAKDLFLEWDENGDGEVAREELHRALGALGIAVGSTRESVAVADALFDEIDADTSGKISMLELENAVKPASISRRRALATTMPRRRFGWQASQQVQSAKVGRGALVVGGGIH